MQLIKQFSLLKVGHSEVIALTKLMYVLCHPRLENILTLQNKGKLLWTLDTVASIGDSRDPMTAL